MLVEGPQPEEDDAPKSVADMSQAELEELVLNIFMVRHSPFPLL